MLAVPNKYGTPVQVNKVYYFCCMSTFLKVTQKYKILPNTIFKKKLKHNDVTEDYIRHNFSITFIFHTHLSYLSKLLIVLKLLLIKMDFFYVVNARHIVLGHLNTSPSILKICLFIHLLTYLKYSSI